MFWESGVLGGSIARKDDEKGEKQGNSKNKAGKEVFYTGFV